jgi:large subunit ribosomal protein L22
MEVRAVTRFTGISAQKARLVLDEMRGKRAEEAVALLQFMPQQSARVVAKTIKSALANASENYGYDTADMVITRIYADQAPIRRWRRFGARGRFKPWRRPSSHITVILEERVQAAPTASSTSASAAGSKGSKGAAGSTKSAPQGGSKK